MGVFRTEGRTGRQAGPAATSSRPARCGSRPLKHIRLERERCRVAHYNLPHEKQGVGKPVRVNVVCRVRVPRILIVLKGSQHGTHERYYLIYRKAWAQARVRWSLLSDTHWPRVARPPPRSRDSASSTAASPRSAKKARHRPASSAASSAAHRKHLRPASERRASSRAPSSSLHSSFVCQTPIGSPANQAGSGDPRRPLQGCCCSARHELAS